MSKVPPLYFSNQWNFLNVIQLGMLKLRFTIGPDHLYPKNSMHTSLRADKQFRPPECATVHWDEEVKNKRHRETRVEKIVNATFFTNILL